MKIKVRPFPQYKITDECLHRDVINNSQAIDALTADVTILSAETVMVSQFKDGNKGVYKTTIPIEVNGEKYISAFVDPVHLFFQSSIDNFLMSEEIKNKQFPECGKKLPKIGNTIILDFQHNQVHECYARYFSHRITSILMMICSIEAFINRTIPKEFVYTNADGELRDKKFIELKFKLEKKINTIIPSINGRSDYWDGYKNVIKKIYKLYELRNSLTHLKNKGEDDFKAYLEDIKIMLEYDIPAAIENCADFMNLVNEIDGGDFIEFIKN